MNIYWWGELLGIIVFSVICFGLTMLPLYKTHRTTSAPARKSAIKLSFGFWIVGFVAVVFFSLVVMSSYYPILIYAVVNFIGICYLGAVSVGMLIRMYHKFRGTTSVIGIQDAERHERAKELVDAIKD